MATVRDTLSNNQLLAMDDVRYAAYAYYEELKKNNIEAAVKDFFRKIEPKKDLIHFKSFKAHMSKLGMSRYTSEKFFNKLATGGANRDSLQYKDIVTLLFIINTGRPFCQKCKSFIEGLFFTCVQCFQEKKDYHFNFCTSCYHFLIKNENSHDHKDLREHKASHAHTEFADPVTLLLLKVNKESGHQPPSQHTVTITSSTAIKPPEIKGNQVIKLVQFVVECVSVGTAVAQCTIM